MYCTQVIIKLEEVALRVLAPTILRDSAIINPEAKPCLSHSYNTLLLTDLDEVTPWVLASSFLRDVDHGALQHLEQRLKKGL